jgi:hypothetical protein
MFQNPVLSWQHARGYGLKLTISTIFSLIWLLLTIFFKSILFMSYNHSVCHHVMEFLPKKRLWLRPLNSHFKHINLGFMVLRFITSIRLCGNEIKRQLTNYGNQINCLET